MAGSRVSSVRSAVQFVAWLLLVTAIGCAEDLTAEKADLAQLRAYATDNLGKYDVGNPCVDAAPVVEKTSALRKRQDGLNAIFKPLFEAGKRAPVRAAYDAEYAAIDGLIRDRNDELVRCRTEREDALYLELKTKVFDSLKTKGAATAASLNEQALYRLLDEVAAACAKRGRVQLEALLPAGADKRARDEETIAVARSNGLGGFVPDEGRVAEQFKDLAAHFEASAGVRVRETPILGDVKAPQYVLTVEAPCL